MSAITTILKRSALSISNNERGVILGASLGTAFEWYDFFLYGSLAAQIGRIFASGLDETASFLFALAAFAVGFLVRPLGALFFGRMGDLIGRKYTFLLTIVIMGAATFGVGLMPGFATLGVLAPILLVALRILQGLAIGGEFGGALIYVAEHAPPDKRGYLASCVISTSSLGLILSLLIVLLCRRSMTAEAFDAWGWRIPFLFSIVLLGISVWIRLRLQESPVFLRMKAEGRRSRAPLTEIFGRWANVKLMLVALFGTCIGSTVSFYTANIYARLFLINVLKVDSALADAAVSTALILAAPFYLGFGWLSDRIGRKWLFIAGLTLAVLTWFPIFSELTHFANPDFEAAIAANPVVVIADPAECSFQFDPVGKVRYVSSCDVAKRALSNRGIPYTNLAAPRGSPATIQIGSATIGSYDARKAGAEAVGSFNTVLGHALASAGYPSKADPAKFNAPMVIFLIWLLVLYTANTFTTQSMAMLELFPARIRYSAFSFPYHFGVGWWGGMLPVTATAIVVQTGDIYGGLWYPMVFGALTIVVGSLFVPETKDVEIGG